MRGLSYVSSASMPSEQKVKECRDTGRQARHSTDSKERTEGVYEILESPRSESDRASREL